MPKRKSTPSSFILQVNNNNHAVYMYMLRLASCSVRPVRAFSKRAVGRGACGLPPSSSRCVEAYTLATHVDRMSPIDCVRIRMAVIGVRRCSEKRGIAQ